jgi:hypothetical protein
MEQLLEHWLKGKTNDKGNVSEPVKELNNDPRVCDKFAGKFSPTKSLREAICL